MDWVKKNLKALIIGVLVGGTVIILFKIDINIGDRTTTTGDKTTTGVSVKIDIGDKTTTNLTSGNIYFKLDENNNITKVELIGLTQDVKTGLETPISTSSTVEFRDLGKESETGKTLSISRKLPFSTAIITYEYKGGSKGEEIVYMDMENNRIAVESSTDPFLTAFTDDMQDTKSKTIYDSDVIYQIDMNENKVLTMENKRDIILAAFMEQIYLGNPVVRESFMDKDCIVYLAPQGKAYFWNGILLKQEIKGSFLGEKHNFTKEAVDIQLDVKLPIDIFKLPDGIQVQTMQEMFKDMEEESKKARQELDKRRKEYILGRAERDPEVKKIIEQATRENGSLDVEKAEHLMDEKEKNELIEKAKKYEGGEEVIKEALKDEVFGLNKLRLFVSDNEIKALQKSGDMNRKNTPEIGR